MEERTMIKGKYVGLVTIEFDFEEKVYPTILPFEQLLKVIREDLTGAMKKCLEDEFIYKDICTVEVEQQYADLYLCEGGEDDGKTDRRRQFKGNAQMVCV
jgi:hypothetical protein